MPVDVTEQKAPDELLGEFKQRYQDLLGENQSLTKKIKDNEQTALKLLGAIETLEYLNPPVQEEEVEEAAPADA
jgi:hypothetical protein|tara:strand:+ start:2453 stop:2674 length:222 start_codon:yes stop_codon:yes gene_type:complete